MSEPESLKPQYFDDVYEANSDPWSFETSEYEKAKYAATLEALPKNSYENALEIGCSIGVLTESLARRCRKLVATDVSQTALNKAKNRCADLPQVKFELQQLPRDFPDEDFDLILLSEVGYYLSPNDWRQAVEKIVSHLTTGGSVVLVHWTPFVADYPQTGDAVHESFISQTSQTLKLLTAERQENYRLDVFEKK